MKRSERPDLVSLERGHGRRQGEHAGGDRDGDGEHVVDEQCRRRDEAREPPEVVLGDHVGAAARLVGVHRLRVGEDDDRQHYCNRDGDRHDRGSAAVAEAATRTTSADSVA